jgi:hypothetical protein
MVREDHVIVKQGIELVEQLRPGPGCLDHRYDAAIACNWSTV